eukprot:GHVQ01014484.1.p2 GENE.GHVQ01014484.1~~GHVQ01014484.1.p2  ORF type:complete len:119 (+),score=8.53 GHVQ01014484.1:1548-1904(+)
MIPDTGGNVTVYGSTGRDYYESCLKNGVQSQASTEAGDNVGFHFNNNNATQEFIDLHDWRISSNDSVNSTSQPWTNYQAQVSARVAGLSLKNETVWLSHPTPDILVDFCQPQAMSCYS